MSKLKFIPKMSFSDNNLSFVLQLVSKWLPFNNILKYRLVCKRWNRAFCNSDLLSSRVAFLLLGENKKTWFESLRALVGSQRGPIVWRHFQFSNMNMERICLANSVFFENFVLKYRRTLTSLSFNKCPLSIGRFVELLAYCKHIRSIQIIECPLLFETSVDNWKAYIPFFEKNISQLHALEIQEWKIKITKVLSFIAPHLTELRRLTLFTNEDVPSQQIVSLVLANKNLEELHLGCCQLAIEEFKQICKSEMRLCTLCLVGMDLPAQIDFETPALRQLTTVILEDVTYTSDLFKDCDQLSNVIWYSWKDPKMSLPVLFGNDKRKNQLTELTLSLPGIFLGEILVNTRNLKILQIYSVGTISFRPLCEYLEKLQVLRLRYLKIDREILPFFKLKCLKEVDFLDTDFGDDLLSMLFQWGTLRHVNISKTNVTQTGLERIIGHSKTVFPNLNSIIVEGCPNCVISKWKLEKLLIDFGPDIAVEYSQPLSPPFEYETGNQLPITESCEDTSEYDFYQ